MKSIHLGSSIYYVRVKFRLFIRPFCVLFGQLAVSVKRGYMYNHLDRLVTLLESISSCLCSHMYLDCPFRIPQILLYSVHMFNIVISLISHLMFLLLICLALIRMQMNSFPLPMRHLYLILRTILYWEIFGWFYCSNFRGFSVCVSFTARQSFCD